MRTRELNHLAQLHSDMMSGENVCLDMYTAALAADLDNNCQVDLGDLAVLASSWLNDELLN